MKWFYGVLAAILTIVVIAFLEGLLGNANGSLLLVILISLLSFWGTAICYTLREMRKEMAEMKGSDKDKRSIQEDPEEFSS